MEQIVTKNKIIICVGISGSGKSTFTKGFIANNSNYLRINRDSLRSSLIGDLNGYYQRSNLQQIERIVNNLEDEIFNQALGREFNIIVDNTNLKQDYINRWLNMVNFQNVTYGFEYEVNFKLFDVSLEEAKRRVLLRDYNSIVAPDDLMYQIEHELEVVKYINKQFEDYQNIKKWIENNHKDRII
jgi:predicted kinase